MKVDWIPWQGLMNLMALVVGYTSSRQLHCMSNSRRFEARFEGSSGKRNLCGCGVQARQSWDLQIRALPATGILVPNGPATHMGTKDPTPHHPALLLKPPKRGPGTNNSDVRHHLLFIVGQQIHS
ncbi:hypothetical protein B0H67DRAFT_102287 [Lasiosphaeris hirsuta]|uniref:Uncharacterized protein n=1 Tax=Lasiosphaeris hirsuta TaxID=260670 RepID=A0AA40E290_9PEZI|nr:hypothetical protein B0H67DRAFT_102287 [Lasiosphaeris hirsuta]